MSDEELRAMFEAHGAVSSCILMRDEEGKSKGFGFVNFEEPEQAFSAVTALNGGWAWWGGVGVGVGWGVG